jgi:pyridoxal phosphate enzyme (YggS family)
VAKYLQEKSHISDVLLMDYAVGKAGDLFKWKTSKIGFVFGVDISKDNIMNSKDGACVRYLTDKIKNPGLPPKAIFLHGNSGLNIRSNHKAFYTNQEKEICRAVFGQGDSKQVAREYLGIARDGFHISSCQFAMHYFFEKKSTLHSFLRNLSECTRLGGYFVGTCYNGQRVFDALRNKKMGESIRFDKNGKKIFEIVRQYSNQLDKFPQNENSIGLAIHVFQESINKWKHILKLNANIKLHFVGKLQTNKIADVIKHFSFMHSLDNDKLALKISIEEKNQKKTLSYFIQVNLGEENQKSGILKQDLSRFINYCKNDLKLNIIGLMCLPPINENSEKYFKELKQLAIVNHLKELSMGMSNDYISAIKNGATFIRIGSAIFED